MAYTTATLNPLGTGFLENTQTVWLYTSSDSEATIKGAAYFSDGANKGVKAGDVLIAINASTPAAYVLQFSSATTVGATVVVT